MNQFGSAAVAGSRRDPPGKQFRQIPGFPPEAGQPVEPVNLPHEFPGKLPPLFPDMPDFCLRLRLAGQLLQPAPQSLDRPVRLFHQPGKGRRIGLV